MLCNDFECVYEVDGECEPLGTECTGDMCEEYGSAQDARNRIGDCTRQFSKSIAERRYIDV